MSIFKGLFDKSEPFALARKRMLLTKKRCDRARKVLKAHGITFKEIRLDGVLDVHNCITFWPYSGVWKNRNTGYSGNGLGTLLREIKGAMK